MCVREKKVGWGSKLRTPNASAIAPARGEISRGEAGATNRAMPTHVARVHRTADTSTVHTAAVWCVASVPAADSALPQGLGDARSRKRRTSNLRPQQLPVLRRPLGVSRGFHTTFHFPCALSKLPNPYSIPSLTAELTRNNRSRPPNPRHYSTGST